MLCPRSGAEEAVEEGKEPGDEIFLLRLGGGGMSMLVLESLPLLEMFLLLLLPLLLLAYDEADEAKEKEGETVGPREVLLLVLLRRLALLLLLLGAPPSLA